jgi:hypothetical protein
MLTYDELQLSMLVARFEEALINSEESDQTLLDEISALGTESLDGETLPAKVQQFVESKIRAILGTEHVVSQAAAIATKQGNRLISKVKDLSGISIDKEKFMSMSVTNVIPYEYLRRHPQMFTDISFMLRNIGTLVNAPIEKSAPLGAPLVALIKKIESAGYVYRNPGVINSYLVHHSVFDPIPAADTKKDKYSWKTETIKNLGYTPERVRELASTLTNNNRPGYFQTIWTALKSNLYSTTILKNLILKPSGDEVNRVYGIHVRTHRIGVIKAISLYHHYIQAALDIAMIDRLVRCMINSMQSGQERLYFMSIDPNKLLLDASVTDNIDEAIEIDAEETPIVTDEIASYTEAESAVEQFKIDAQKKLTFNYPTEGVKNVALESLRMDEMRTNKAIAKKMLSLFEKRIKKNEHLLKCLENTSILVGRELRKVSTTLRKQDLDNIVMRNIPKYEDIHRRIAFYNGIRQDFTTSIAELYRPVLHEKDYGKGIENYTNLAMISGFEMFDAETYFSSKPGEVFASNDATYRGSLSDAGYTVAEVLRLAKAVDSMQRVLTSPLPVMNGNIPVTESMIEEAVTLRNAEDKVDRVTACNVRRTRYGMLSRIRSELLLESVLSDTYTTYRLLKALNRAKK